MNEKEIFEIFDDSLEWKQENGGTNQEAAARFPDHQEELLELLEAADQAKSMKIPGPRPEFKAAARTRMINRITALESSKDKSAVTKPGLLRQLSHTKTKLTRRLSMTWIIVLGLLATALAGGGGVAYASNDALPGDALYPVKTAMQDVELAFASDEKEVGLRLTQLDINIDELEELVEEERLDDLEDGLEEYEENFQAFLRVRTRVNYEEADTEDSINQRLQTQYMALTNLQEKFQHSDKIQQKLQEAAQLTETGKTYGPNDGGKPDVTGEPNGAGPGEPGNKPEDAGQGKPEDAGSGDGSGSGNPGQENQNGNNGNNGEGNGNGNNGGQGGNGGGSMSNADLMGCEDLAEGELCTPEMIGYKCTENENGELNCTNEHPEYQWGAYLCQKTGDGEIVCKPETAGEGQSGQGGIGDQASPSNGPGAKP